MQRVTPSGLRDPRSHSVHTLAMMLAVVAVLAIACTADPASRKQRYFASGNLYFDQARYAKPSSSTGTLLKWWTSGRHENAYASRMLEPAI